MPLLLAESIGSEGRLQGWSRVVCAGSPLSGCAETLGIIIPVAHRETVFDLTESEVVATFRLLQRVKAWMDAELSPDGYNVGWNCGRIGGQEVFHAHLHVIPRFRQEPLAGQGIRSHLKSDANRW